LNVLKVLGLDTQLLHGLLDLARVHTTHSWHHNSIKENDLRLLNLWKLSLRINKILEKGFGAGSTAAYRLL
jgi:hypothetical protein